MDSATSVPEAKAQAGMKETRLLSTAQESQMHGQKVQHPSRSGRGALHSLPATKQVQTELPSQLGGDPAPLRAVLLGPLKCGNSNRNRAKDPKTSPK